MDKPFSVLYEEFRQGLASLINNSSLPSFVVESVLQNYLNEVHEIAKNQYQVDKARYEKEIEENENTLDKR